MTEHATQPALQLVRELAEHTARLAWLSCTDVGGRPEAACVACIVRAATAVLTELELVVELDDQAHVARVYWRRRE